MTQSLPSTAIQPSRPWESSGASTSDGLYGNSVSPYSRGGLGYGSSMQGGAYGGGLGSSMYGSSMYGGMNRGLYGGGGMYGGSSMYGAGGMGTGLYGGSGMYGGSSMYGGGMGGMYGGGMGGMYGAGGMMGGMGGGMYGAGGMGGMMGPGGPYGDPNMAPPAPPTAWQHMLMGINGVMTFFGRLSFLVRVQHNLL